MRTVSVKSAARILDVLELMAGRTQGLRVNEMARQLAMPKSSASSLLATLEGRGYVRPTATAIGWPRCSAGGLGGRHHVGAPARQRPDHGAAGGGDRRVGLSSAFRTPDMSIQYIAKAVSANELRYDVDLASPRPAYCTSIGQVILSGLDAAALDRYFETHELVAHHAAHGDRPEGAFDASSRKARAEATSRSPTATCWARPASRRRCARKRASWRRSPAIAPSARFDAHRDRIVPAVVAAAHELSQALVR